jgi:hypothetical protein
MQRRRISVFSFVYEIAIWHRVQCDADRNELVVRRAKPTVNHDYLIKNYIPTHPQSYATKPVVHYSTAYFLVSDSICWTRVSISSELNIPLYLGMWFLPLEMMLCNSLVEAAPALSEESDGPPKWRPAAVLP